MAIEPIKGFYVHDEVTDTDGVAKMDMSGVDGLESTLNVEAFSPQFTSGKYISATTGMMSNNSGFNVSEPLHLNVGDNVVVTSAGYSNNTAILSYKTPDGRYRPIIVSVDSSAHKYEIVIEHEEDYYICSSAGTLMSIKITPYFAKDASLASAIGLISNTWGSRKKLLSLSSWDYFFKAGTVYKEKIEINGVQQDCDLIALGTFLAETENGTKKCLALMTSVAPFNMKFNEIDAFYQNDDQQLNAGTYSLTFHDQGGEGGAVIIPAGLTINFTLTNPVPAGGQLVFNDSIWATSPTNTTISSYSSPTSTTPIETVSISEGSQGTNLGTIYNDTVNGNLNSCKRCSMGSNRWKTSIVRKWMNSDNNNWCTNLDKFIRPPANYAETNGMLSAFSNEFRSSLTPIKIETALCTTDGGTIGGNEVDETYDKVVLPSLSQLFVEGVAIGIPNFLEGQSFQYWKNRCDTWTMASLYTQKQEYIIKNNTNNYVRWKTRSTNRNGSCDIAIFDTNGVVSNVGAIAENYYILPVFFMCEE